MTNLKKLKCRKFSAQLLRQNYHHRRRKEDRYLLEAAHRFRGGDHLRLQVPHRRRKDPLLVRRKELQKVSELSSTARRLSKLKCDFFF